MSIFVVFYHQPIVDSIEVKLSINYFCKSEGLLIATGVFLQIFLSKLCKCVRVMLKINI